MKAEINNEGLLILHSESKEDSEKVHQWYQKWGGRFIMPDNREELAFCRFNTLDIVLYAEPN